jgi:hypothetical protein
MKRFFYKDALAAIWMAKHFGMKFSVVEFTGKSSGGKGDYSVRKEYTLYPSPFCNKDGLATCKTDRGGELLGSTSLFRFRNEFFVHADSLSLLEPQVGDWGRGPYAGEVIGLSESLITIHVPERHNGKSHFCQPRSEFKIMSRTGIPFMWPESEDA